MSRDGSGRAPTPAMPSSSRLSRSPRASRTSICASSSARTGDSTRPARIASNSTSSAGGRCPADDLPHVQSRQPVPQCDFYRSRDPLDCRVGPRAGPASATGPRLAQALPQRLV